MDKLKPCPHCGGIPTINYGRTSRDVWAYITCACGATQRNHHGKSDREAAALAVDAWNMRVESREGDT